MSVSLLEVIEAGGYDLTTEEDARWLLSQVNQFEQLITEAEDLIDNIESLELEESEAKYQQTFGDN